ncbi:YlbF family regulator [Kiritimatiellaeota bacterium B1221]|nr:YlbF family regulator [Kiritimatiellaeota bacterium B1221]
MSDLLNAQETPVISKTKELCASLLELDSYKRMKAQLDAFVEDADAQKLYQDLSQKQSELVQKQETTGDLSEEEIQAFEDQRERLLMHPVAGGFVEAQQGFEELRDTVVRYVTKTFELGRVPTEEEVSPKQGGCCGGGCGGGSCGSEGGCS